MPISFWKLSHLEFNLYYMDYHIGEDHILDISFDHGAEIRRFLLGGSWNGIFFGGGGESNLMQT